jgi:hypothetical protein
MVACGRTAEAEALFCSFGQNEFGSDEIRARAYGSVCSLDTIQNQSLETLRCPTFDPFTFTPTPRLPE